MRKYIKATVATTHIDIHNECFSKEALSKAACATKIPITFNFDRSRLIGIADSFKLKNNILMMQGAIDANYIDGYLCPGIKVNKAENKSESNKVRTIKDFELVSLGYVQNSSDKNLTKIKMVERE